MEKGEIRINTENIFPIIKKAVYSDHEIFLRELVSNGVDAISKRRMASMAGDCENTEEAQVKITINREKNTLTISDNGIGMNDEEIKKVKLFFNDFILPNKSPYNYFLSLFDWLWSSHHMDLNAKRQYFLFSVVLFVHSYLFLTNKNL